MNYNLSEQVTSLERELKQLLEMNETNHIYDSYIEQLKLKIHYKLSQKSERIKRKHNYYLVNKKLLIKKKKD